MGASAYLLPRNSPRSTFSGAVRILFQSASGVPCPRHRRRPAAISVFSVVAAAAVFNALLVAATEEGPFQHDLRTDGRATTQQPRGVPGMPPGALTLFGIRLRDSLVRALRVPHCPTRPWLVALLAPAMSSFGNGPAATMHKEVSGSPWKLKKRERKKRGGSVSEEGGDGEDGRWICGGRGRSVHPALCTVLPGCALDLQQCQVIHTPCRHVCWRGDLRT